MTSPLIETQYVYLVAEVVELGFLKKVYMYIGLLHCKTKVIDTDDVNKGYAEIFVNGVPETFNVNKILDLLI